MYVGMELMNEVLVGNMTIVCGGKGSGNRDAFPELMSKQQKCVAAFASK